MKIILPKTKCEIDPNYGPVFFLAGPIKGGDDWQAKCCEEIRKHTQNFYAVLPNRYNESHHLMKFRFGGDENCFDRQLSWERYYLNLAGTRGCIIFWLPEESKSNPRTGNLPYAMDTRGELGEWRGRLMYEPELRVIVGAEAGFPGLSQIERNFNEALMFPFLIHKTLADTVQAAIKKIV